MLELQWRGTALGGPHTDSPSLGAGQKKKKPNQFKRQIEGAWVVQLV